MVENHTGSNDLLDTTDCLEAVGVFKGWKNLLFVILAVCLLLLQASFLLVDRGYIKITGQAYGNGPDTPAPASVEAPEPTASDKLTSPAETDTPNAPDAATPGSGQPQETSRPGGPEELSEPNTVLWQPRPSGPGAPGVQLRLAAKWLPERFLDGLTFGRLSWAINLINAVLILTATLYCLTLLFSLKVSMHGRLGGINHITRAFFLSLLMVVLLLPWQKVFGSVVTGAVFTPDEIVKWYSAKTEDMLDLVLYYLRFSGYGVLMLLLLILSQIRSLRWAKAILRRLEII